MHEPDLFTAHEARDNAIDRVESNADADWMWLAYHAVRTVCRARETFTTLDVRAVFNEEPREPRAWGAVMRRAQRGGHAGRRA